MAYSATQLQVTHVLQELYRRLGGKVTLATDGSTTTLRDTKLADELLDSNEDDIYNGGTIIVVEDAGGSNAAPEGEFSRITDYVASSQTVSFSPALTTAIASGDRVMIVPPDFPVYDMLEVLNDALKDLSEIPLYDTSITTTNNQTEYTLPLAVKGGRVEMVEVQTYLNDSNDNRWSPVPNWREGFANAGSTGTFILPQFASGYTIRITYKKWHPRVDLYDDYISEYFHPKLVHSAFMAHVLQWRNDNDAITGGADNNKLGLEQKAWSQYDRAKIEHRPEIPQKQFQPFPSWGTTSTSDEFMPIPLP